MVRRALAGCAAFAIAVWAIAILPDLARPPATARAQALEAYARVAAWDSRPALSAAGYLRRPDGVAAGDDGTVFVVDNVRAMVHVFRNGAWIGAWGGPGSELGQLGDPHGIALLGDRVLVADTGNRRVQVFERDGRPVTTWDAVGTPWDVAVTGDEMVLVTDQSGDQVIILDRDGRRVGALGGPGTAFGELKDPTGITAWADGRIALVDGGNDRLQIWNADGSVASVITNTATWPWVDVAVYDDQTLAVAALRRVHLVDLASGNTVALGIAPVPGAFTGLAVQAASAGIVTPTVWLALTHDDRTGLRRYDTPRFNALTDWRGLPSPPGEYVSPRRITVDADTAVVLDTWPRVQRVRTDGTPLDQLELDLATEIETVGDDEVVASGAGVRRTSGVSVTWSWAPVTPTVWVGALAVDTLRDRLYAVDLAQQQIAVLDLAGRDLARLALDADGTGRYRSITDLAVRPDGRLLIVNRARAEIELREPDGRVLAQWPVTGVPLRITSDSAGAAYVLTREGWAWKLSPTGAVAAWWDAGAEGVDQRGAPTDIAAGPDGRVYVADGRGDRILVFAPDPTAPPPNPPEGQGCRFVRDKWAAPGRITLGQTVGVTLTVSGECIDEGAGSDVMLVLDRSGSMAGRKMDAGRAAAVTFIGEMNLDVSRVGLVVFNTEATSPISLTTDARAAVAATAGFGQAIGGTDIGEAIQLAARELADHGRSGVKHVMVVMTDGRPEAADVDADLAAAAAKAQGVRLFSIGFGVDVDPALMHRIASTADDYFFAPSTTELAGIYTEIARRISGGVIARTAVITDVVPANMLYLVGSAVPPVVSYVNRTLRWELRDVRGDIRLSYRLRPLEIGRWPTNVDARMRYRDGLDRDGELVFPIPQVIVTGVPKPIYLPVLYRNRCLPRKQPVDVALVIDSSSTMTGEKHAAAKLAARGFVARLRLPDDHAAIVGFNRTAWLALGLTGDRDALDAAIDGLAIVPGTVIDAGLRTATTELLGVRARPGTTRVIVLLSDGLNNAGPAPVRAAASAARAGGIAIYTVGYGDGADLPLLEEVAGDVRRAYVAAGPEDFARIYAEIAGVIGCR
jgi:Mg-chelatase subunit ChlD